MKKESGVFPLVEETINKSKQNNGDIVIGFKKNKSEEDEKSTHSADFSGNELKENQNPNIPYKSSYLLNLNKNELEKYNNKLKEKTMRMEIEKRSNETERLRNKYEERNSHMHTFDNNPQFQKMLKKVCLQLFFLFLGGILYLIYDAVIYFSISNKKESFALIGMCLSIFSIAFCVILFISLNIGLLNDPNLSKTFRLFIIVEYFAFISSFIFNIILAFLSNKYLKKAKMAKDKFIVYVILIILVIYTLFIIKFCWDLFAESVLILFRKKTEYSILIIKEQSLKSNEINFNTNMSVNDNNITNEALYKSTSIFNNEEEKDKNNDKEEEQYKTQNYFNNFHYSVSSARKNEYHSYKKN